jgi:4-oxalocrotonate tautomerase
MPLIQVSVVKGVFSSEQKTQMISRLTDAMVSVEGENMRGVTWVKIDEVESYRLRSDADDAPEAGGASVRTAGVSSGKAARNKP